MNALRVGTALATVVSVFVFPWPVAAVLALALALRVPLMPLATGILLDVLYYAPGAHWFPLFALSGALVTVAAYAVRGQLKAGIIG